MILTRSLATETDKDLSCDGWWWFVWRPPRWQMWAMTSMMITIAEPVIDKIHHLFVSDHFDYHTNGDYVISISFSAHYILHPHQQTTISTRPNCTALPYIRCPSLCIQKHCSGYWQTDPTVSQSKYCLIIQ